MTNDIMTNDMLVNVLENEARTQYILYIVILVIVLIKTFP